MDNRNFFNEVSHLKELQKTEANTFRARWKLKREIKKTKKNIDRMIKEAAKAQAQIVYDQTCHLYQDIVESNLK